MTLGAKANFSRFEITSSIKMGMIQPCWQEASGPSRSRVGTPTSCGLGLWDVTEEHGHIRKPGRGELPPPTCF